MKWLTVARSDFRNARRSRMLWGAIGVFLLFVCLPLLSRDADAAPESAVQELLGIGGFFLPLVVVVMAYLSITGERESGTIRHLLGFPVTRLSVVAGKFASRALLAVTGIALALAVGAGIILVRFGDLPVAEYLQYSLLTLYFAAVYTGIAVGISALSSTRGRALAGSVGVYFAFGILWVVPAVSPRDSIAYVVESVLGFDPVPELYDFVFQLSPTFAYAVATEGLVFDRTGPVQYVGDYSSGLPFYLQDWFMLVILAAWMILPLTVGYLRFRDAELG